MPYQLSDDDKQEINNRGNYFDFGVHAVKIGMVEPGVHGDEEKEYIEFTLLGPNEEEDTARLWFTEKAGKYSFNTMREIAVHNAKDADKEKARNAMDNCVTVEDLAKVFNDKVVGGECWFTVYPSKTRTYTGNDGTLKKSIDKNIYGWQPKPREDLLPNKPDVVIDPDTVGSIDLPDDKPKSDAKANIPKDWA